MKRIYIYFFLTFLYTIGYAQNADFDLSLKLNTQSNRYYFEVVLTNTSSDATYTFNRSSDSCLGGYPHACILVPELEYKDGSMHEGLDLGFFYFTHEGKKELKILPGESYSCNIAYLCEQQIMGMLRRSDLGNVKQIRVRLKKFKALKTASASFGFILQALDSLKPIFVIIIGIEYIKSESLSISGAFFLPYFVLLLGKYVRITIVNRRTYSILHQTLYYCT